MTYILPKRLLTTPAINNYEIEVGGRLSPPFLIGDSMAEKKSRKQRFKAFLKRNMTKTWAKRFSYQVVAFLISLAMIGGVTTYAFNKSYDEMELVFSDSFSICVHTGAYGTPQNSIAFVQACIDNGVSALELNVRQRPDGTVVIGNDIITTNNDGVELRAALELLQDTEASVNLVIDDTKVLKSLHDLLIEYGMINRVFLTGIEVFQANKVNENCPDVDFYINYIPSRIKIFSDDYQQKILDILEKTGAIGINCNHANISRTLAQLLHENGYKLSVWTVDKKWSIKRVLVSQPDIVTTNRPELIQSIIDNWGK